MNIFEGDYNDDLDIISLHIKVLKNFGEIRSKRLGEIDHEIKTVEDELNVPMFYIDRKLKLRKLEELKKEKDDLNNNAKKNEYMIKSKLIVEEYNRLPRMEYKIVFNESGANIVQDKNYSKRQILIIKYLNLLKNYFIVDISKKIYNNEVVRNNIEAFTIVKDLNPDITPKNNYEDRENFRKAMMKYQCKEDVTFPADLFSKLDDHFRKYKIPIGEEIKRMNVNKEWHFKYVKDDEVFIASKELLFRALSEIGYNTYYKFFYSICHEYWGWHVRDISDIEDDIMEDYDLSQRVYERIKGKYKKKISSVNVQYRLFRHLRRRKHICEADDFKLIKTQDILDIYEEIWFEMCDTLGWDKEYIF